jgi:hypothetical protein
LRSALTRSRARDHIFPACYDFSPHMNYTRV